MEIESIKSSLGALALILFTAVTWAAANPKIILAPPESKSAEMGIPSSTSERTVKTVFVIFAAVVIIAVIAVTTFGYARRTLAKPLREATRVDFVSEDVIITINEGGAKVSGLYTFHNPYKNDRMVRLWYPFAKDKGIGKPKDVLVEDERGGLLPFDTEYGNLTFKVRVPAEGDSTVRVAFEQPCFDRQFEYILTTTREWRRPLIHARFTVETPATFGPLQSNYPLVTAASNGKVVTYELYREDFWPEEDLILTWQNPGDSPGIPAVGPDIGVPAR